MRKFAFTLAEVLITLAVLGIVAVLTLPTIIQNTQQKALIVALRKKYAELTQVVRLSVLENGSTSQWDYSQGEEEFVSKYLAPYMKTNKCDDCWLSFVPQGLFFEQAAYAAPERGCFNNYRSCFNDTTFSSTADTSDGGFCEYSTCQDVYQGCLEGDRYLPEDGCNAYKKFVEDSNSGPDDVPSVTYTLPDGSQMGVLVRSKGIVYLYLDVNGAKRPNKFGVDKYLLFINNNQVAMFGDAATNLEEGDYACTAEGNGFYCGAMIKRNDWKFPANYKRS